MNYGKDFKHFSKEEVDQKLHLELQENEEELGSFLDHNKSRWKTIGNRKTDYLTVTTDNLIFANLIKAYVWPANPKESQYSVHKYPYSRLKSVSITKNEKGNDELKITLTDEENENEWSKSYWLKNDTSTAITLINSDWKK